MLCILQQLWNYILASILIVSIKEKKTHFTDINNFCTKVDVKTWVYNFGSRASFAVWFANSAENWSHIYANKHLQPLCTSIVFHRWQSYIVLQIKWFRQRYDICSRLMWQLPPYHFYGKYKNVSSSQILAYSDIKK